MENKILLSMSLNEFKQLIQDSIRSEISKNNHDPPGGASPEYFSRKEVAKMLGLSLPTLAKYIKRGIIPAQRLGGKIYILKSDIEKSLTEIKTIKHNRY